MTIEVIEEKFQTELNKFESWAYLRVVYNTTLGKKDFGEKVVNSSKWKNLKSVVYGMSHWFSSYENIVFSDTLERRMINGKLYDKTTDCIIDVLGKDKCLTIENPVPIHLEYRDVYTKNIVSIRLLDLLNKIAFMLSRKFIKTNKFEALDTINSFSNLDIDYRNIMKRFKVSYFIYKGLFKLYQPKRIFINCYYSNQAIIKAANDLNIETYEVQHGVVTKENINYNSSLILDKSYLPQYIFVYDGYSKKSISSTIYSIDNILVMGNYYLEYLSKEMKKNNELETLLGDYTISIGISLQWICEDEVISFINEIAKDNRDKVFLLLPREIKPEYAKMILEENVLFFSELDCHTVVLHCDYHMSAYSACLMEASQMGIRNILFNLNNYAKKYYEYLLDDNNVLVNNLEEFNHITFQKKITQPNKNQSIEYEKKIKEFFNE